MTDLEFIRKPAEWPRWPVLPVVKRSAPNSETRLEIGLVWADANPTVIVGAYLYGLDGKPGKTWREKLDGYERQKFESFEELLKVWRID